MHERTRLGRAGEALVVRYLQEQGFTILERNYTQRYGEVDLIACTHDLIAFIEVKMRSQLYNNFDLSEVILPSKQRKIVAVAKHYLANHDDHHDKAARFDVALVHDTEITYLDDAFRDEW